MAKKRIARVNEQMKRELIQLLQFEVRDPRVGAVSITDVEVSPDLYHAKVYYAPRGDDEEKKRTLEGLKAAAPFLRTEISKRMSIRKTPELHFALDNTLEHALHIEALLREAKVGMATEPDVAGPSDVESADPGADEGVDRDELDDDGS